MKLIAKIAVESEVFESERENVIKIIDNKTNEIIEALK